MKIGDVYGGKFIKANREGQLDIPGTPYDMVVTITGTDIHEFKPEKPGDEPKRQITLTFAEIKDMEIGLNATNARAIAVITGSDDTDNWIGKRIELCTVPEERSATGHAVRVRKPRQQVPAHQASLAPQTPAADALGSLAAIRIHDKIKLLQAKGKSCDIASLRLRLCQKFPDKTAAISTLEPANWPKDVMGEVAVWFKDVEASAMSEDDIPF